jgi:glutathione peroxidase
MNFFDIAVEAIDGTTHTMARYRGHTMLIVNVASACGFTPQYQGLESLYRKYRERGLVVLGFPCNQFGRQEPGTNAEIQEFCTRKYDVTFPLFSKIDVNGANAHPLFVWLKSQKKGVLGFERIKWNFSKFLVDGDGVVVKRYGSGHRPSAIEPDILDVLALGSAVKVTT